MLSNVPDEAKWATTSSFRLVIGAVIGALGVKLTQAEAVSLQEVVEGAIAVGLTAWSLYMSVSGRRKLRDAAPPKAAKSAS